MLQPNTRLTMTTVPIVVVITKFDLYVAGMQRHSRNKSTYQTAEEDFKKKYGHKFSKNMSATQILYALVSSMFIPEITSSALTSCRIAV